MSQSCCLPIAYVRDLPTYKYATKSCRDYVNVKREDEKIEDEEPSEWPEFLLEISPTANKDNQYYMVMSRVADGAEYKAEYNLADSEVTQISEYCLLFRSEGKQSLEIWLPSETIAGDWMETMTTMCSVAKATADILSAERNGDADGATADNGDNNQSTAAAPVADLLSLDGTPRDTKHDNTPMHFGDTPPHFDSELDSSEESRAIGADMMELLGRAASRSDTAQTTTAADKTGNGHTDGHAATADTTASALEVLSAAHSAHARADRRSASPPVVTVHGAVSTNGKAAAKSVTEAPPPCRPSVLTRPWRTAMTFLRLQPADLALLPLALTRIALSYLAFCAMLTLSTYLMLCVYLPLRAAKLVAKVAFRVATLLAIVVAYSLGVCYSAVYTRTGAVKLYRL